MREKTEYIKTRWEVWTYDVWGNAQEGYEVNDRSEYNSDLPLRLKVEVNNPGTVHEFKSAYPTDKQIRQALDLRSFRLDLDGDDLTIYVNRERDGYPCGELHCTSHKSLAPIKEL